MKASQPFAVRILCLLVAAAPASVPSLAAAAGEQQHDAPPLFILDQYGRPVPNAQPSSTAQIVDVSVGPGGAQIFSPATVNISVGDTVRWTWASSNHSVSSGSGCTIGGDYCSPNDMNCAAGLLSNTGTVYQHTFAQAGSYSYFCVAHCSRGMVGSVNVAPVCTAPPPDMIAWWPGDGNTRDIQNADNGGLRGGAAFAAGKVGQAFSLDGVDSYVQMPHNARLNPTGPFTVDLWANANSQQPFPQSLLVDKSHGYTDGTGWAIQTATDGTACFFYGTGSNATDFHGVCTTASILDNQWHHLAGVFTGTEFRIYVDGALNNTFPFSSPIANNTRPVDIGAAWGGGAPTRFFHGLIDEVEIFDRALTQSEVQAIYNAGSAGKCKPPQPTAALSRKTHGGAGTFDIDAVPNGKPGIECRSGGASGIYQMVIQFPAPITAGGATLSDGTGSVSGFGVVGSVATIDLMNITNAQRIVVKLTGVSDGTLSGVVPVAMSVLIGDTNGDGAVNAGDTTQTRARSGQTTDATNFRSDVNVDGSVNSGDTTAVRARSGTSLP